MDYLVRHRGLERHKERRLVHVAPDPGHSRIEERPVVLAPPLSRLGVREVRERADPRPHDVMVLFPLACFAVEVPLATFYVDRIVIVDLDAGVYDGDEVEALFSEFGYELLRLGEAFLVPGKDAVAVHVVNVEVEGVARDVALAEVAGHLAHLALIHVAVAALLVAQRPHRRHRSAPGQLRVAVKYVVRGRAAEDVVDDVPALGAVVSAVSACFRQVELDAVGVVEEETVGPAAYKRDRERDRGVDVVEGGGVPSRGIYVPEDLVRARFIEAAGSLPAPEVPLALFALLVQSNRAPQRGREYVRLRQLDDAHPELLVIGGEDAARGIGEGDSQGVQGDVCRGCLGGEGDLFFAGHLRRDRFPILLLYRLRGVVRRPTLREHPDPEEVRGEGGHLDRGRARPHTYASLVVVQELRPSERLVLSLLGRRRFEDLGQNSSLWVSETGYRWSVRTGILLIPRPSRAHTASFSGTPSARYCELEVWDVQALRRRAGPELRYLSVEHLGPLVAGYANPVVSVFDEVGV